MNAAAVDAFGTLQAALQLAEEWSLPVFPCGVDKKPRTEHGFKDATRNIEQIASWNWTDALIGVPTGAPSRLLIVDVDPSGEGWYREHADKLACGRIHRTRRGWHLIYTMPETEVRNSASKLAPGVDVRAQGGYVVWWAAHGLEAIGGMEEIAAPPAWLLEQLLGGADRGTHQQPQEQQHHDGQVRDGGRNTYLSREAFRLRKQGSSVEQIMLVLPALNAARCVPPLAEDELQHIADGKAQIEPETQAVSLQDFRAYMPTHSYLFVPTREMWAAASVNARVPPISLSGDKDMKASAWLDQNSAVEQMTWAPGLPMLIPDRLVADGGWIERTGVTCFNLYRPPTVTLGDAAQAGPWIEHVRRIYPGEADHTIRWCAYKVQHPEKKINHALVLGGAPGIGKDTIITPVTYAVGPWNFAEVSPVQLLGRFNGFLKSVILRISEARDLGDVDRYGFYEHTKGIIAAPPDVLRVDEKNLREHAVMNVCGVIITTNHKTDGIFLPADDRRHFVAWSEASKDDFSADYWNKLYRWYGSGGIGHVAAYLASLDIAAFDPKAPPPKTEAFHAIVDANRSPEDGEMADAIDALGNRAAITLEDLITYTDSDSFREWLRDRRNRRQVPHRLEAAGYVPVRNDADTHDGQWKVRGKRQTIYARRELPVRDRIAAASILCRGGAA